MSRNINEGIFCASKTPEKGIKKIWTHFLNSEVLIKKFEASSKPRTVNKKNLKPLPNLQVLIKKFEATFRLRSGDKKNLKPFSKLERGKIRRIGIEHQQSPPSGIP